MGLVTWTASNADGRFRSSYAMWYLPGCAHACDTQRERTRGLRRYLEKVAPHLTVIFGATSDLDSGSLPRTPSWLLWLPPRGRNLEGERFINRPTMICNATSHRWCSFKPLVASEESRQAQSFALYAEVIDATYKEHPRLQSLALPGQRLRPSGQTVQTSAKCPVKPFDEKGNRFSVSRCSDRLSLREEALFEIGGVQLGKDVSEGIERWNSIRQFQKGTQPVYIRFAPLLHFREALRSTCCRVMTCDCL